jgi:hypothetical protein
MATLFHLGKGSVLSISVNGGTAWTPVKQLKTVSFAGYNVDYEDISNMDSPSAVREFAPTLADPGTAECQGIFLDSDPGQIAMNAANVSQVLAEFKLQMAPRAGETTGFLRTFSGYVQKGNNLDAQFDKASTYAATIKVTGPYTDAAGS